jgi:hypothetical protein
MLAPVTVTVTCGSMHVPNVSNDTIAAMLLIPKVAAQRFVYCQIPK